MMLPQNSSGQVDSSALCSCSVVGGSWLVYSRFTKYVVFGSSAHTFVSFTKLAPPNLNAAWADKEPTPPFTQPGPISWSSTCLRKSPGHFEIDHILCTWAPLAVFEPSGWRTLLSMSPVAFGEMLPSVVNSMAAYLIRSILIGLVLLVPGKGPKTLSKKRALSVPSVTMLVARVSGTGGRVAQLPVVEEFWTVTVGLFDAEMGPNAEAHDSVNVYEPLARPVVDAEKVPEGSRLEPWLDQDGSVPPAVQPLVFTEVQLTPTLMPSSTVVPVGLPLTTKEVISGVAGPAQSDSETTLAVTSPVAVST